MSFINFIYDVYQIRIFLSCLFFFFVALSTCRAACGNTRQERFNSDGSAIRVLQRQCEETEKRTIQVQIKPTSSASYHTVLTRTQNTAEAATGGGNLRDIEGDGFFEYEETGICGVGPNCEGTVFKLTPSRKNLYLFFQGGYANFSYIPGLYIESGRTSCCSWEHHLYSTPKHAKTITENQHIYSVTVGSVNSENVDGTPCFISGKRNGKWAEVNPKNKGILRLCELYGSDYIVNPPLPIAED